MTMALYIFGIEFLDMTPKEQTTNEKINYISSKLRIVVYQETLPKSRMTTEWEKLFVKHISSKNLGYRMYKKYNN